MLVDVIELNYLGNRIPKEHRAGLPVTRGTLAVDKMWTHEGLDRAPVHAHLVPPRLEPLYGVKVRLVRGRTLVLVGQQRVGNAKRKSEHSFEQIWVCRLLIDEQVAAANAPPPMSWPALDHP